MSIRHERCDDQDRSGQRPSDDQTERLSSVTHDEQDRQGDDHERLEGHRGSEEPTSFLESPVECRDERVVGKAHSYCVFGMPPEHRDVEQDDAFGQREDAAPAPDDPEAFGERVEREQAISGRGFLGFELGLRR